MIPKIIHYCWFGRRKMPKFTKRCIASWKKHLPGYEIKEWNEDNFNLEEWSFAKEAYDNNKFAFVTDVVRMYALYHEGGIYLDTDVEVLRSFDDFLQCKAFLGFEDDRLIATCVIGSEKGGELVKAQLDNYRDRHFIRDDGSFDTITNVRHVTGYLSGKGLIQNNSYQDLPGLATIYHQSYFSPISYINMQSCLSSSTVCIHHFTGSWLPPSDKKWLKKRKKMYHKKQRRLTYKVFWNKIKNYLHCNKSKS